jgi:hypothetical protein
VEIHSKGVNRSLEKSGDHYPCLVVGAGKNVSTRTAF